MKETTRSMSAAIMSILASLPWWAILWLLVNASPALLGLAGTVTATAVAGWFTPVLLCASVLLIGRSFWVIYVRKIATRATVCIAWTSLVFMVGFWSVYLVRGGWN